MERSRTIAVLLSATMPGLGQLYKREWVKGTAFLASALLLDMLFGATAATMEFFSHAFRGVSPATLHPEALALHLLPFTALVAWSVIDARRMPSALRPRLSRVDTSLRTVLEVKQK